MAKKLLLLSLILFFSLGIFIRNALALNPPENPGIVPGTVGMVGAQLTWTWPSAAGPGDGIATRFILSFRPDTKPESDWVKTYPPIAGGPDYVIDKTGLNPGTDYQWTIAVEALPPTPNSEEVNGISFSTAPEPPPDIPPNGGNGGSIDIGLTNPLKAGSLLEAIDALINILFLLGFAIAPILLIYAAFLMLFSHGDAASVNKARTIIFWTLISLSIIVLAKGVPAAIKGALGG